MAPPTEAATRNPATAVAAPTAHTATLAAALDPTRCRLGVAAADYAQCLGIFAEMMVAARPALDAKSVYTALLERERLGRTTLGHGVAIPHARLAELDAPLAALLILERGLPCEAPDTIPVDLLAALLVPEHASTQHLDLLAALARKLASEALREKLRGADSAETACGLLVAEDGG